MAAESKIENYLVENVQARKGQIRKLTFINHRGAPDRMVWIPPWKMPVLVEVKAPGEELEDYQGREHKRLNKMGLATCMINSEAGVDRLLKYGPRGGKI